MLNARQGFNGGQNRNIMMLAMQAMMSGKSPQEFLRSIPELSGMDFTNIQGTAEKLCKEKGVNIEDAKRMISSQLQGMK
jgi:hypothetical protein